MGSALILCSSLDAATLCSAPGAQPDGLDVSDVSFNGANATDCNGVFTGTASASNLGFEGFTAVTTALSGGAATGTFGGATFTLSASSAGSVGTWSLAWSGAPGPIALDLVAVPQTAVAFASYFFDDLALAASPGSGTGAWAISYLVNESLPLVTSFSVYARDFRGPIEPPTPAPLTEPGILALLGLGLIGLLASKTRRRT